MRETALVIVHPWNLALLSNRWDLLGNGHCDLGYEKHVRYKLKPYILAHPEMWIGIYLGLREFRIHPALENKYDFVLYDDEEMDNFAYMIDLGINHIIACGYAWNICVASFARRYSVLFNVSTDPQLSMRTRQ